MRANAILREGSRLDSSLQLFPAVFHHRPKDGLGYEEGGFAPHDFSRLDNCRLHPDRFCQEVHPIFASRETIGHLGHTGKRWQPDV